MDLRTDDPVAPAPATSDSVLSLAAIQIEVAAMRRAEAERAAAHERAEAERAEREREAARAVVQAGIEPLAEALHALHEVAAPGEVEAHEGERWWRLPLSDGSLVRISAAGRVEWSPVPRMPRFAIRSGVESGTSVAVVGGSGVAGSALGWLLERGTGVLTALLRDPLGLATMRPVEARTQVVVIALWGGLVVGASLALAVGYWRGRRGARADFRPWSPETAEGPGALAVADVLGDRVTTLMGIVRGRQEAAKRALGGGPAEVRATTAPRPWQRALGEVKRAGAALEADRQRR